MHRKVTASLIVASAMLASGCGTLGGTVVIDEDGNQQVVYGRDFGANPAVEYPRAQAEAYRAFAENQQPLLRITATDGQPITINAASIEVWAPGESGPPRIQQYVSPWASVVGNVLTATLPLAVGQIGAYQIAKQAGDVTTSVAGAMSAMSGDAVTAVGQAGQGTIQVAQSGLQTAENLGTAGIQGVQQTALAGYQQIGDTAQAGLTSTQQTAAAGLTATTQTATAGLTALQNTSQFALGELGDTGRFGISALGELGGTGIIEAGRDPVIVNPVVVEQPPPVQIPGAPAPIVVDPFVVPPADPIFVPVPVDFGPTLPGP